MPNLPPACSSVNTASRAVRCAVLAADRDTSTVVGHLHRGIAVQCHLDQVREPRCGLVDRVVDQLPHQVVQALGPGATDVHPGALAHCVQPFQQLDALLVVGVHGPVRGRRSGSRHGQTSQSRATDTLGEGRPSGDPPGQVVDDPAVVVARSSAGSPSGYQTAAAPSSESDRRSHRRSATRSGACGYCRYTGAPTMTVEGWEHPGGEMWTNRHGGGQARKLARRRVPPRLAQPCERRIGPHQSRPEHLDTPVVPSRELSRLTTS